MTAPARLGYSLVEALVALLVAGLLTIALAVVLALVGRLAVRQADAAAAAETERTVAAVLGLELRTLTAADASAHADSIRLRAFRGGGPVCTLDDDELIVDFAGIRMPEEDKDSVLLLFGTGPERALAVLGLRRREGCGDGSLAIRIDTADAVPADANAIPAYALVFETGAYSIADAAFRYRRGAAGRQPLTEDNLAAGSALDLRPGPGSAAAAVVRLRSAASPQAAAPPWLVHMPQGAARP